MGTRGLTKVISGERTVVAQYGQWDHYPSGQGVTILEFLRSLKKDYTKFIERLKTVRFSTDTDQKEWDDYYKKLGAKGDGWVTMEQADKFKEKYPMLSRDNGGEILQMIMNCTDKEIVLVDSSDFGEGDSSGFGCEYKYIVDFDKGTFDVYEGTSHLLKSYSLQKLPTEKTFLKQLEPQEEEN
jgi:hypothetical protein